MLVNEFIKSYRIANALTQRDMAEKLHMTTQTYARMEKGETRMTEDKLNNFAKLVHKTPREIREMAEKGQLFSLFQENENNSNHDNGHISNLTINNNYYGDKELSQEIEHLKNLLAEKDKIIAMQAQQLETLQTLLKSSAK